MRARTTFLATVLLTLLSCAVNVPPPTLEHAGGDPRVLEDLTAGRSLYIAKCSACHGLYSVERYSDSEWDMQVRKMMTLKKVKLSPEENGRVVRYLQAANGRD